jgi:hypothetical protein
MNQNLYSIFKDVVEGMESQPSFSFGYWPEVRQDLLLKGKDKAYDGTKFPLIVMGTDFEEKRRYGILADINPKFYLIAESKTNYSTPQRITNVYTPVLYPLYEEFLQALEDSARVHPGSGDRFFEHTKRDLFYMGFAKEAQNQNQLHDILDAIELNFGSIVISKKC